MKYSSQISNFKSPLLSSHTPHSSPTLPPSLLQTAPSPVGNPFSPRRPAFEKCVQLRTATLFEWLMAHGSWLMAHGSWLRKTCWRWNPPTRWRTGLYCYPCACAWTLVSVRTEGKAVLDRKWGRGGGVGTRTLPSPSLPVNRSEFSNFSVDHCLRRQGVECEMCAQRFGRGWCLF